MSILKQLLSPLLKVRPDGELGQVERYIWWQRLGYCYVVPTMEHDTVDLVEYIKSTYIASYVLLAMMGATCLSVSVISQGSYIGCFDGFISPSLQIKIFVC